jgi:hypothetical protein
MAKKQIKKYMVYPPDGYKFEGENEPMWNFDLRMFAKDMIARNGDVWTDWDEMVWNVDIKEIIKMLRDNGYTVEIIPIKK